MNIRTQDKEARARDLFLEGYNCSQAVFAAFAEEMGLSLSQALRLAGGLGGGIGGLRFTCGAFNGAVMALGMLQGTDDPGDQAAKKRLYARVQAMHGRFVELYETSCCKDLLKSAGIAAQAQPSPRTPEYYRARPCARYVEACARILCETLGEESL